MNCLKCKSSFAPYELIDGFCHKCTHANLLEINAAYADLRLAAGAGINEYVDAFLAWPLPDSVCADPCACIQGYPHRSGTVLLGAAEARLMFEYVLERAADRPLCPFLTIYKLHWTDDYDMAHTGIVAAPDPVAAWVLAGRLVGNPRNGKVEVIGTSTAKTGQCYCINEV